MKLLAVILSYIRDRYSTSFHLEEEYTETELGMCILNYNDYNTQIPNETDIFEKLHSLRSHTG